ncbi:MAG: hypothetical protein ACKOB1_10145, partial [Planctomycetia bacterium]
MTFIPVSEHFFVWGTVWLVLAAAWAAACVWVDRDAEEVFGRGMPWTLGMVGLGTGFFLGSLRYGLSAVNAMLPALLGLVGWYACWRDLNSPAPSRILPKQCEGLLRLVAQACGRGDALGTITRPEVGGVGSAGPTLVLLKKDGRPFDGRDAGQRVDSETSEAITSVQRILTKAIH